MQLKLFILLTLLSNPVKFYCHQIDWLFLYTPLNRRFLPFINLKNIFRFAKTTQNSIQYWFYELNRFYFTTSY